MNATWTYTVTAKASFGGFQAYLIDHGAHLLVSAQKWKGEQPRIVLERMPKPGTVAGEGEWGYHDEGFADWLPLLKPCSEQHTFEGDVEHAQNLLDQWRFQRVRPMGDGRYRR